MVAARTTVFDLSGNSCVVPAGSDQTVADVKQHATKELGMESEYTVLLHGSSELRENEPLPSGDLNLVLLNRPRPENWDALIRKFCRGVHDADILNVFWQEHLGFDELVSKYLDNCCEFQDLVQDFGIGFAKEVLTQSEGAAFPYLPQNLQEERSIVLHGVRQHYRVLRLADTRFKSDLGILFCAVRQKEENPLFAVEKLYDDLENVLAIERADGGMHDLAIAIALAAEQAEPGLGLHVMDGEGDEWRTFRLWLVGWDMSSIDVPANSAVDWWETFADEYVDKKSRRSSRKAHFKNVLIDVDRNSDPAIDKARLRRARRFAVRANGTSLKEPNYNQDSRRDACRSGGRRGSCKILRRMMWHRTDSDV